MRCSKFEKLLILAKKYSAKRETCEQDLIKFLENKQADNKTINRILQILRREAFIDHRRYAREMARKKLLLLGWGKEKIRHFLHQKEIEKKAIDEAIDSILEGEYLIKLKVVLKKKLLVLQGKYNSEDKIYDRLFIYGIERGFEETLVKEIIIQLYNEVQE